MRTQWKGPFLFLLIVALANHQPATSSAAEDQAANRLDSDVLLCCDHAMHDVSACDGHGCDGLGCDGLGCDTCGCSRPGSTLDQIFSYCEGIEFSGWLNAGMMYNFDSPSSRFNGPYNAVDRSNEPMFNQAYSIAEKRLPKHGGFGVGARIDMLWGEDYLLAQSNGIERRTNGAPHWNSQYYGLAFPQAYLEVGSEALSVKVGHFYSIVGYEGLTAPTNFFYSKSYSYQFAGPFTHWGALATLRPSDRWQFQFGLTNGWDTFNGTTDSLNILAGAKYTSDYWWTSFAITSGDQFNNLAGLPIPAPAFTNRTRYSLLLGLQLTEKLEYVFHNWYGSQENGAINGSDASWYGIDQYAYYALNDRVSTGMRFEWFRDDDGTRIGLNRPSNPNNPPFAGDLYSLSFGINYQMASNLLIRPEIRADWFDGQGVGPGNPFDDGNSDNQVLVGADIIWTF